MIGYGAICTDVTRTHVLSRNGREVMLATKGFAGTVVMAHCKRLLAVTEKHEPGLPERYIVELALEQLVEDLDRRQLEPGMETCALGRQPGPSSRSFPSSRAPWGWRRRDSPDHSLGSADGSGRSKARRRLICR